MLEVGSMKEAYDLYIRVKIPDTFSYKGMTFEHKQLNTWGRKSVRSDVDRITFSSRSKFASVYWYSPFGKDLNFTYYSKGDHLAEFSEITMQRLIAIVLQNQGIKTNFYGMFSMFHPMNLIALHEIVQSGNQDFLELEEYADQQKLSMFTRMMAKYRSIKITKEE